MFSIIIPLFNKQSSIQNTLNSVLDQKFDLFEIWIVDDGSTDNSYIRAKEYAESDSRIHLIKKENGGVSSARNLGISYAKYEYIAFLDADDTWEPDYLFEQEKLIRDFPEAYMWGLSWNIVHNNIKQQRKHNIPDNFRGIPKNYWERGLHLFWTSAIVVRKTAFEKTGSFDERIFYGEDLDMWFRIMLNFPVAYCDKTLANYIQDAENRVMNQKIPLEKHLPWFIEKFNESRLNNKEFRKYFDMECLYRLYPYVLKDKKNSGCRKILDHIDLAEYKISFRLRFLFPKWYFWYMKLKGLILGTYHGKYFPHPFLVD